MENTTLNYNLNKTKIIIPDYGRNVQLLMDYIIKKIKDKEDRTAAVQTLVTQIAKQNPNMKNQAEYLQKIWGHLHIISGYQLDVTAPFPLPEETVEEIVKVKQLEYKKKKHKYRFYGKNVELMIEKAKTMDEGEQKSSFIESIVGYMKLANKLWNDDKVSDDVILKHLSELSNDLINLDEMPESAKVEIVFNQRERERERETRRPRPRNNNKRYYKR